MRCSDTNSLQLLRMDAPPTDRRDPPTARRLLEFLRERGLLDPAAVERAAKVQLETRQRIDVVIAELGLLPAPDLETLLPPDFLRRNGLLPIVLTGAALVIATTDPFNTEMLAAVAYFIE